MPEPNDNNSSRTEHFLRLMMSSHGRIYSFILTMVPNWTDADDLMQETIMVMWRKYDNYKPGTSFVSWGLQIAKYEIINSYKKKDKRKALFREEVEKAIMEHAESINNEVDARLRALNFCFEKLDKFSQKLIKMHYEQDMSIKKLAVTYGKTVQSIYKNLNKVYDILLRCIRKAMIEQG